MIPRFRVWDKHRQKMFANDELIIWNGNVYANDSKKLTCNNLKGWSIDDEYFMQST
nr:MAG TPA: YopX protein [Caudoviricetes sp.]